MLLKEMKIGEEEKWLRDLVEGHPVLRSRLAVLQLNLEPGEISPPTRG